jgi:two-component system KDP operon response regulator KdpE
MSTANSSLNFNKYTLTLDDDAMVGKVIEKVTGIRTVAFLSSKDLIERLGKLQPIAAFIDINLGLDECGLDLIPILRKQWINCPILVITGDPTEQAVGDALNSGADDFLQKPIRAKELLARLQVRLADYAERRARTTFQFGDVIADPAHRVIEGPAGKRYLSPIEMNLILCLWQGKGSIVPRAKLKKHAWAEIAVTDSALDRKLFEVRKALNDVSKSVSLKSHYGKGVRLEKKL